MENLKKNLQIIVGKIQRNVIIETISGGMMFLLPLMMVGAFATLFATISIGPYQDFIANTGLKSVFSLTNTMTTEIISLYVVFSLSHKLADNMGQDGLMAGLLALMAFLLITPLGAIADTKIRYLSLEYIGSRGMIVGMITALVASRIYVLLMEKNVVIKMPPSVPPFVSKTFSSLIPGFIIAIIFATLNALVGMTQFGNIHDMVYTMIQTPLQGLGTSVVAALVLVFLAEFLWFFGIHGSLATSAILYALFYPFDLQNLAAFESGAVASAFPFIVTMSFISLQKGPRVLAMSFLLLRSKSTQMKTLGKIGLIPSFFGISEPYKFGLPMVLNPVIFIPMVMAPMINVGLSYFATVINLIPRVNGVPSAQGIPEFIRPFMIGGWRMALWHVVLLGITILIYYPFLKYTDKQKLAEEMAFAEKSGEEVAETA